MELQVNVWIRQFELICKVNNVDFLDNWNKYKFFLSLNNNLLVVNIWNTYLLNPSDRTQTNTHTHSNMFIDTP